MSYGFEAFVEGKKVVSGLAPANIFHSIKIINQKAGVYSYAIPSSIDDGQLLVVTGKITNNFVTKDQLGNSKAYISNLQIIGNSVSITMTNIPDINIVSKPLYLNFFKWRP
ncbi:hypothetical protein ACRN9J_06825 [Shewanella baltica]|uniref:hypothetical protein n=1 Tax=Shewanella baltica TaxID=62322 RepID=UPI003D7B6026